MILRVWGLYLCCKFGMSTCLFNDARAFCRKADADRTMTDARNAAGHAVDDGKVKAAQVSEAAQDYSKQASDKAVNTYAAAKGNSEQVRLIFASALFSLVRHSNNFLRCS